MLVNQLINLLQKCPSSYSVVLNVPIDADLPLLVDLYEEDFQMDHERGTVEVDGTISEAAENQIQEMLDDGLVLQDGQVMVLTRDDEPVAKQTTKSRMKDLGLTVVK